MNIEGPVVVSRKGQARIERGHPWVFRSDVVKDGGATPGAVVRVAGVRGEPLGYAFWSASSEIRLRMLERGEKLAAGFLRDRIERALRWRDTVAAGAEAYRVVHGEGDGLPSLVVDRYGDYLAVQTLSQGTERAKPEIVAALVEILKPRGIVERNDPRVRTLEGLEQTVSVLHGEVPDVVEVSEGDVRLGVDLRQGQKTGLFLDQRENHLAARTLRARARARRLLLRRRLRAAGRARGGRGDGGRPLGGGARAREGERRPQRHLQRLDPRRQRLRPAARARPARASASTP